MAQLIKNKRLVENDGWQSVPADATTLPEGDIIVPLSVWQAQRDQLVTRNTKVGVRLDSDQHPKEIIDDLHHFSLVAFNFPKFRDGRPYSGARLLRERYGFTGEIRAVGDVLRDQIFYMYRCGFDAFEIAPGHDAADALKAFDEFTVTYQPAVDEKQPLWRRG